MCVKLAESHRSVKVACAIHAGFAAHPAITLQLAGRAA
jgi:hypothetical protein